MPCFPSFFYLRIFKSKTFLNFKNFVAVSKLLQLFRQTHAQMSSFSNSSSFERASHTHTHTQPSQSHTPDRMFFCSQRVHYSNVVQLLLLNRIENRFFRSMSRLLRRYHSLDIAAAATGCSAILVA